MGLFSVGSMDVCGIEFRVDICKRYDIESEIAQLLRIIKESDRNSTEFIEQYDKIKVIMQQAILHDEYKMLKKVDKEMKGDYKYLLQLLTDEDVSENSKVFAKAGYTMSYIFGSDDWVDNVVKRFALNGMLYKDAKVANVQIAAEYENILRTYYGWALSDVQPLQAFNEKFKLNIVLEEKGILNWVNNVKDGLKLRTQAALQPGAQKLIKATAKVAGVSIEQYSSLETDQQKINRRFHEAEAKSYLVEGEYFVTRNGEQVHVARIIGCEENEIKYELDGKKQSISKDEVYPITGNTYKSISVGDMLWYEDLLGNLGKGKVLNIGSEEIAVKDGLNPIHMCKPERVIFVYTEETPDNGLEIVKNNAYEIIHFKNPTPDMLAVAIENDLILAFHVLGTGGKNEQEKWQKVSDENMLAIVKTMPGILQCIENPKLNLCLEALKVDKNSFKFMQKKYPEVCLEAVKLDGLLLKYVDEQSLEICKEAVAQNKKAIEFVQEEFKSAFVE